MDSDIWLPLVTLVLGWAGAQVTEVLRDRRTTTRELLGRRAELQRMTLLELQEALRGIWTASVMSRLVEEVGPKGTCLRSCATSSSSPASGCGC
jgi:hypothetical protein